METYTLKPSYTQLVSELTVLVHQQMTIRNCVGRYLDFIWRLSLCCLKAEHKKCPELHTEKARPYFFVGTT